MSSTATILQAGYVLRHMRALPIAAFDAIAPGTSLILAPHPDDESLGCGGLIAEAVARGRPPFVVCVTDGAASHPGSRDYPPARLARLREAEMLAACEELGLAGDRVTFLKLPDAAAPWDGTAFDGAVARIVSLIRDHDVSAMFATWAHDPHCDHAATATLARRAARVAGITLKFYPVWGWLLPPDDAFGEPVPTGARLDITRHLPAKRRAIAAHQSQYTDLITDSPNGFRLPSRLLDVFDAPYEVFLDP